MENANLSDTTSGTQQAAHFGAMAGDWWNPKGSSAMLHRLNPVRLGYIRSQIDRHWQGDGKARRPLSGKRAVDIGCGAGLVAEPLARLGADVTAVDAAEENVVAAIEHAALSGFDIDYRVGGAEAVAGEAFDLVTCLEVIEHVDDPAGFVAGLAALLAPGGLMILSTPNRTALSKIAIVGLGETVGGIPPGTHDWNAFLTPDDVTALVEPTGLRIIDTTGIGFGVASGFRLTSDVRLNYMMTMVRD